MAQGSRQARPLVVFAGGGTGGHLYPAIALARALQERLPGVRFLFLGTQRAVDRQILAGVDCEFLPQELPVLSRLPWRWPGILLALRNASRPLRRRFLEDRPAAVVGTGGMAAVPAVRLAHALQIPILLLNPDAIPGRANRFLSPWADTVYVQWEEAKVHLSRAARVQVLGCPIRPDFDVADQQKGIASLGLDCARKTLLVTGASQGARTINDAVLSLVDLMQSLADWQVLHLTGNQDYERVRQAYQRSGVAASVMPYTDAMADALAAADVVISRAGASTLAEITASGRPSILMPYPFHKDMHQVANAQCLVRAGAARLVLDQKDAAVNAGPLREALEALTRDQQTRDTMSRAALRMGRSDAAARIADDVLARLRLRRDEVCESLERSCELAR